MTNFFSKKLYLQGLKKIKISGIAFSLIIIILNAFVPIIGIIDSSSFGARYRGVEPVEFNMIVPFCLLLVVLVPILAHDMFSYLNERNQSDFYHSIPQKRTCVYTSFTAAVLTWAFGTIIASTVVNTILWSLAPLYTFTFSTVILGMLPYLVLAVQMAGITILAMTVTGTKISNFLVAILFFLFFRAMATFSVIALEEVTPVLNLDYSFFKYFGLEFFLPFGLLTSVFDSKADVFVNAALQIYTLIVGIIFLVLGGISYNKRRSESANKSAPSKLIQHIYRFAVSLPFVFLVAFTMIVDGIEGYQIILVLIAVLVYVLYELITTKKIKNVVKSLPLLAIPVLVTILMTSGIFITRNVINSQKYDADEIAGYRFTNQYSSTYEHFNTENIFVSNEDASKIIEEALVDTIEDKYNDIDDRTVYESILIKLKNGRVVARDLHFRYNDHTILEQLLINSPEYSLKFIEIPKPKDIVSVSVYGQYGTEKNESDELYKCFYEEYNKLSYQDKMAVKYPQGEFNSLVQIGVNGYVGSRSFHSSYHVFYEYMPKTAVKYLEIMADGYAFGYQTDLEYDAKNIKYYVDQAQKGNLEMAYGKFSLTKAVGTFENENFERTYNGDNVNIVSVMSRVFDIILSDKNAFVYDDPNKIYRLNYYLDASLIEVNDFKYDTEPYVVEGVYIPQTETVQETYGDYSQYFYINQEMHVSISDENLALIDNLIESLYNVNVEKTPIQK